MAALQQVFQSVVISRLTYAVPAWWGFTTSADQQRIETILRRAVRADLWPSAARHLTRRRLVISAHMRMLLCRRWTR